MPVRFQYTGGIHPKAVYCCITIEYGKQPDAVGNTGRDEPELVDHMPFAIVMPFERGVDSDRHYTAIVLIIFLVGGFIAPDIAYLNKIGVLPVLIITEGRDGHYVLQRTYLVRPLFSTFTEQFQVFVPYILAGDGAVGLQGDGKAQVVALRLLRVDDVSDGVGRAFGAGGQQEVHIGTVLFLTGRSGYHILIIILVGDAEEPVARRGHACGREQRDRGGDIARQDIHILFIRLRRHIRFSLIFAATGEHQAT